MIRPQERQAQHKHRNRHRYQRRAQHLACQAGVIARKDVYPSDLML